jgi:uncharacterized protein with PIN domain
MKSKIEEPRCDACNSETTFVREVPPIGDVPGVRMFQCVGCGRAVWQDFKAEPPQLSPTTEKA